jgi:hypothetical protein
MASVFGDLTLHVETSQCHVKELLLVLVKVVLMELIRKPTVFLHCAKLYDLEVVS